MNPKIVRETSPYLRKPISVERMMLDVLIALIPVVIYAVIAFGWQPIVVILISAAVMIGVENLCIWIRLKKDFNNKFTINQIIVPLISAVIFAMLIPQVNVSDFPMMCYVVVVGSLVAILVGKMFFGGLGGNIFNPAATGRIFITICFAIVFKQAYASQIFFDTTAGATALQMLHTEVGIANFTNAINTYSIMDLFLGNVPGTMGEGCVVAILIGAIYLFLRKSADIRITLSIVLTFTVLMLVAGIAYNINNVNDINLFDFILYQLFGGGLLFGAVFMATDPITSPITKMGRIAFGFLIGALVVLIRLIGAYPEGMAFAILIGNMFSPLLDMLIKKTEYKPVGFIVLGVVFLIVSSIISEIYLNANGLIFGIVTGISILFMITYKLITRINKKAGAKI